MIAEQQPYALKKQARMRDYGVPCFDKIMRGGEPAGFCTANDRAKTGQRNFAVSQNCAHMSDCICGEQAIGMQHQDIIAGRLLNAIVDLRAAPFFRGDYDAVPCRARQIARCVITAAINQQYLVRLRIERGDIGDGRGQGAFFLPCGYKQGQAHMRAKSLSSGQRSRSSGRSQSDNMGSICGMIFIASSRAKVVGSTFSVLHGISVNSVGSGLCMPIR